MKKSNENATINFEPEVISEKAEVKFSKVTNATGNVVYGSIKKDAVEVGTISYSEKDNYLITSLRPLDSLTAEERETIHANVMGWINECLEA